MNTTFPVQGNGLHPVSNQTSADKGPTPYQSPEPESPDRLQSYS